MLEMIDLAERKPVHMVRKKMIGVLIVNRSSLICSLVAAALRKEGDIQVVGWATDVNQALDLARTRRCDVALISTNLPDSGALTLMQTLRSLCPAKILVVGLADMEDLVLRYIEAGASGYVFEEDSVQTMIKNIRAVYNDEALISPELAATLIARVTELAGGGPALSAPSNGSFELTPREEEVLDLIGDGLSNQEIADRLVIEVGTVKNHVHSILQKLEVNNRQDAAKFVNGRISR
jgi:DNA-binding NarL/FixJ family response regulator